MNGIFGYLIAGTVLSVFSAVCIFLSRNSFADIEEALDRKIYPLSFCMRVGFAVSSVLKINTYRTAERLFGLFFEGTDNTEFDYFCITSHSFAVFLTVIPVGFLFSVFVREPLSVPFSMIIAILMSLYPAVELRRQRKKRIAEADSELPDVLSRLSLLTSAGLTLYDAWQIIAGSGSGPLYDEMGKVMADINNGLAMREALNGMSGRIPSKNLRRFASAIAGNTDSGGRVLPESLHSMARDMWDEKTSEAVTRGKAAEQKLMLPLLMIFIGIVIMIAVPLFAGF